MSIVKQAHKKRYSCINNQLAQNNSLSLKARGLMLYLLSLPDDWQVKVAHLCSCMKEGRDSIRTALIELRKAGYVHLKKMGQREGWEYYVFESPVTSEEFEAQLRSDVLFNCRKSLQLVNRPLQSTYRETLENTEEKTNKYSSVSAIASPPVEATASTMDSEPSGLNTKTEASELANYLLKKIKSVNPNAKPPKLQSWVKSAERMMRIDKRHLGEALKVIDWVFEKSNFWASNLQSIDSLRRNYDRLFLQAFPPETANSRANVNRSLALEAKAVLSQNTALAKSIGISPSTVYKIGTEFAIPFDMPAARFKEELYKLFNLKD